MIFDCRICKTKCDGIHMPANCPRVQKAKTRLPTKPVKCYQIYAAGTPMKQIIFDFELDEYKQTIEYDYDDCHWFMPIGQLSVNPNGKLIIIPNSD